MRPHVALTESEFQYLKLENQLTIKVLKGEMTQAEAYRELHDAALVIIRLRDLRQARGGGSDE